LNGAVSLLEVENDLDVRIGPNMDPGKPSSRKTMENVAQFTGTAPKMLQT
jgi:hypothetical protein